MRSAWSHLFLLGALAVAPPAARPAAPAEPAGEPPGARDDAPAGDRAYWLGPEFGRAPVRFADGSWGRFAILTYDRPQDVDIDVESFSGHGRGVGKGFPVRVRMATGQDVVLLFTRPGEPGAALLSAAKAALQPIPAGVTYPG